jgi:hypothetical protein
MIRPLVSLLLAASVAAAQARPDTPEQAAEKVLAAVRAKDTAALKALAENDDPDPWKTTIPTPGSSPTNCVRAASTTRRRRSRRPRRAWIPRNSRRTWRASAKHPMTRSAARA